MEFQYCDEIDTHYSFYLSQIRQMLISATSQNVLNLCTEWIWFLSHMRDRIRRNQHAEMLFHQLKINKLDIPFTTEPPKDETFLANIEQDGSSDWTDVADSANKANSPKCQIPNNVTKYTESKPSITSTITFNSIIPQMSRTTSKAPIARSTFSSTNPQSQDTLIAYKKHNLELLQSIKNQKRCIAGNECQNEKGACKRVSFNTCRDGHYQELPKKYSYDDQISKIKHQVGELLREKDLLVKEIVEYKNELGKKEASTHELSLTSEITALRQKLQELSGIKNTLEARQGSNILQWNESLDKLSDRLTNVEEMGNVITAAIEKTDFKIKEIEENSMKEIGVLQETCQDEIRKISELYATEIERLKTTYETDRQHYEKSNELVTTYEDNLQRKNNEICELKTKLESKCGQIADEMATLKHQILTENNQQYKKINDKYVVQIVLYQKYIRKLEKQNTKNKKNYEKKIIALTKDLELMEKSLQIKLEMQKTNLIIDVSSDKQKELYKIVSDLEERYKSLLQEQEDVVRLRQAKDQRTINELKETISKLERNVNFS